MVERWHGSYAAAARQVQKSIREYHQKSPRRAWSFAEIARMSFIDGRNTTMGWITSFAE